MLYIILVLKPEDAPNGHPEGKSLEIDTVSQNSLNSIKKLWHLAYIITNLF